MEWRTGRVAKKAGYVVDGFMSFLGGTFPVHGQLFVSATIRAAGGGLTSVSALMITDYIENGLAAVLGSVMRQQANGKGAVVDNEAASTLVNNTALTRTISVPTNARWQLEGGHVLQADDVARVCSVVTNDGTAGQNKHELFADSVAANTRFAYPNSVADLQGWQGGQPISLVEGDDIVITFNAGGASAGGTARSSAVVQEWIQL